ncbi:hypothetical protein EDI_096040 [Entamoeba dispar SAW760]|uniref:Rho-GAP domain-containing protein n=1 Tax=Entamoeba dispar (strain ATCC PRA-260 / SAW760) TaxID=370354 RepID=B0EPP2_ENTDS|nr:uncharacterized protein EDI_096040 [Entamoeba dispar SAW760]EDR23472.1 hypothetical protein EDI_096040 [Entamoeba dispar SAW760]|eukprot:EDR23472.1 hypothetical protein EDI_096040 [Entamoeba dispar SAW760]
MLSIIDKYIGKLLETPSEEPRTIVQELSNTRSETKRAIYLGMLKNILELLNVRNKGYSIVFMNQLTSDLQRSEIYQTMPVSKSEILLLTNIVNDIGYRFNSEESLEKVVKAQSIIRGFLYHKRYITYKAFSATKFQQYNSSFLNLHEKQNHYVENIETLIYYLDELRAQPKFKILGEYPYKNYYNSLTTILNLERQFKNGLNDIYGTFPKVSGVGEVVKKYCEGVLEAYKEINLQGAVIMTTVFYEKENPYFKEVYETLSKGQTYAFRYLLQSFPRIQHFSNLIKLLTIMKEAVEKLPEYKEEIKTLEETLKDLNNINITLHDTIKSEEMNNKEITIKRNERTEFSTLLFKIKKEFTKTPSVVEVYLKLGKEIGNIEEKRFLKETRVTIEIIPNIDNYPPNLKTNTQTVNFGSSNNLTEKKHSTSLRPKLQKRTNRQKEEVKLKASGEFMKDIEVLKNNELESIKFEATLFIMNDIIYVSKMDSSEKYHILTEIPLTGNGFSVSNCIGNKFNIGSKVFDFTISFIIPNEDDARSLFLLLREVFFVHSPPKLFGGSLEDILEREGNTTGIPLCIKALGEYLMNPNNLQTEGIFRKNGASNKVSRLAHVLDQMPDHFNSFNEYTVHDIAATFKKFFMDMSEPLFSSEVVDLFIKIIKDSPDEKDEIKKVMKEHMKPMYFKLADFLIHVIKKTVENENITLMNVHAMSVCIGPAIIRSTNEIVVQPNSKNNDVEGAVTKVTRCNEILAEIISDCDFFFQ